MLLVKADLLRKVIGVCVPLDLRVRFAKEVNTTFMLIFWDLQFNNNEEKLYRTSCKLGLNEWKSFFCPYVAETVLTSQ